MADAIYALCDPRTQEVRYIGKATDPAKRLKGHLREVRRRSPFYDWISSLRRQGLVPTLRVLEGDVADWREAERRLISEARARGDRILNIADGGDEPACSRETRAKNGAANAALIHNDPVRRRIWELKRSIGQTIREGFMSNATRAKLREAARTRPDLFGCYADLPDREEGPDGRPINGYPRGKAGRSPDDLQT